MPISLLMKVLGLALIIVTLTSTGCGMKRKMIRPPGHSTSPSQPPGPILGGALKVSNGSVQSSSFTNDVFMRAAISPSRTVASAPGGLTAHIGVGPAYKNPHESH